LVDLLMASIVSSVL